MRAPSLSAVRSPGVDRGVIMWVKGLGGLGPGCRGALAGAKGGRMWVKPEYEVVEVGAEVTAYVTEIERVPASDASPATPSPAV